MKKSYIFLDGKEQLIGLVENSNLKKIKKIDSSNIVGNIYRGKLNNKTKSINGFFVDIGQEKNVLVHNDSRYKDLEKGQDIILQIKKNPINDKGAVGIVNYDLQGKNLILKPFTNEVSFSLKLSLFEKNKLNKKIEHIRGSSEIGFLFRTNATNKDIKELKSEYDNLFNLYKSIEIERNFLPSPKLLYLAKKDYEYFIEDNIEKIDNIIINDNKYYDKIKKSFNLKKILISLDEEYSVNNDMNIISDIKNINKRIVKLPSGGEIIIDRLEAATIIDINSSSAKYVDFKNTALEVNKEASVEIVKQIKFRDISGIIIIDYLKMDKENEIIITKYLKDLFKDENRKIRGFDFTKLGLLEFARERK